MSDLISAMEAKGLLGCDDATLQNYINNGTIRAQRVDGMLMLQRDDVHNLGATAPSADSDDGTIILSGDSEDLSIDLGEVVDDGTQTVVHSGPFDSNDSLTFGEELEVVNFDDDGGTQELSFDESAASQDGLSFTDSNTVVGSAVDDTLVGATATEDFQTVSYDDEPEPTQSTVRRSVRSQRVREEEVQISFLWPLILIVTTIVVAFFIVPFLVMGMAQNGNLRSTDRSEGTASGRGSTDTLWTGIASSFAGFSVEPDQAAFNRNMPAGSEWLSISQADANQPDVWRYKQYRGNDDEALKRSEDFVIDSLQTQPDPANPDNVIIIKAEALDENGKVLQSYSVEQKNEGLGEGDIDPADRQYRVIYGTE